MTTKPTLSVYEWRPGGSADWRNFGDALTSVILGRLGYNVVEPRAGEPALFGCGSILSTDHYPNVASSSRIVVWGSGVFYRPTDPCPIEREYLAVRGPISRNLLRLGPNVLLGDLALLLPHVLGSLPPVGRAQWLHVAHCSQDGAATRVRSDDEILRLAAKIASARHVYTDALHAAVVAHAYGVPYTYLSARGMPRPEPKWQDFELWRLSGAVFDPDPMVATLQRSLRT